MWRRLLLVGLGLLMLAACEGMERRKIILTTSELTAIQAEYLVSTLLGRPVNDKLTMTAPIDQTWQRVLARWPQVRAELDHGSIGLTDDGMLRIRQAEGRFAEVRMLVRQENLDRQTLYRILCAELGYSEGRFIQWLPVVEDTFAKEWVKQAPPGWWYVDGEGRWQRKLK